MSVNEMHFLLKIHIFVLRVYAETHLTEELNYDGDGEHY
jgi:hypothetical protein